MIRQKTSLQVLSTLALAASEAREDTLKSVILNTLFEKESILKTELISEIKTLYHFEPHKPEVEELLRQAITNGEIVENGNQILLTDSEKSRLKSLELEIRDNDGKRFQNFKNFITDILEKDIDIQKIKLLYNVFKDYLYNSFYEFGVEALQNFVLNNNRPDLDNEDFIQESYKKLRESDPLLCDIFKTVVDKFPDYVSVEDLKFLNELSLKTQSFVSLGVKPEEAKDISEMNLIDWVLYLDTNVIYSLLSLHSHPENEACKALVQLIKDNPTIFKLKIRYSDLTLKELLHKKNDFKILDDKLSDSAIKALLKSDKLDDFSKQFYTDLLLNRKGTLHPSTVIDLSDKTLKADNIEISRTGQKIEKLGPSFLAARTQDYLRFVQEKNDFKEAYCKEKHIPFRPATRNERQAYHDIALRELILDYRYSNIKGGSALTFNQVKYFAITLDDLLIQFDQHTRRTHLDEKGFPIFFKPSFLLNKLSKLLPIKTDDYKKAYFRAVTSRGFNKDIKKSDDIQKIASYLKQKGIDNNEVIYNLISEDLFLEKYHKHSEDASFNADIFLEEEINRQFKAKQIELEKSKKELENVKTTALTVSSENNELNKKIGELSSQLQIYSAAADSLSKKVKKLEKQNTPKIILQPGLNFEVAEKQKELDLIQEELKKQKVINTNFENQTRRPLREKYIWKRVFYWRLKTFGYLLFGILVFFSAIMYLCFLSDWDIKKASDTYENYKSNIFITGTIWLLSAIYNGIFIKRFSDQFGQSNVNAFKLNVEKNIPSELKHID